MNKTIKVSLCSLLTLQLSACATSSETSYQATSKGFGGEVNVTLTVKDDKVTSLVAVGEEETTEIGKVAIDDFNETFKAFNGKTVNEVASEIDSVSGATVTSKAVANALTDVLKQAKGVDTTSKKELTDLTDVFKAVGNSVVAPVEVEVTIKNNQIENIAIVGGEETDSHGVGTNHISQTVVDYLIPRIIENQSLAVDAISGATNTSNAVINAVDQAINAAGGDSSEWYTEVSKSNETIKLEGYDVIVVGLGGSGVTSYISAAENGASVFGIETTAKIGGQSATVSGPMAINPQLKMDSENNGEKFLEEEDLISDWIEYCKGDAKEELVRWFVNNSGETMDWLMNDYDFDFEQIKAFFHPKQWRVWANYAGDKTEMFTNAIEKAKSLNDKNDYKLELTAKELIVEDGVIKGVRAESYDGSTYEIYGDSVILATGGFISNDEMMTQYIGNPYNADTIGTQKGDGIKMGLSVNAGTYNIDMPVMMHIAQIKNIIKSTDLTADQKAILTSLCLSADNMKVGKDGTRYMSESGNVAFDNWIGDGFFYSIYTQKQIDEFTQNGLTNFTAPMFLAQGGSYEVGTPVTDMETILSVGEQYGNVIRANTLEELAEKTNMDVDKLIQSATDYTSYANGDAEDPFGKDVALMTSLEEGPYVAVAGAGYSYGTCGGLDINEDMNVLTKDGIVIENLYSVGQDSMGVLFSNQVPYVTYGGAAQGWVLTSGRQAGLKAAEKFAN